jgi:hypothetical protein
MATQGALIVMDGLDDILSELRQEHYSPLKQAEPGYGPWGLMEGHKVWSVEDKQPSLSLALSKYEAYWLWWRLKVHLRTYENFEWSEMKEVLECLIQRISTLSTSTISCTASSDTPAEVSSEQAGIQDKPLHLSNVEDVKTT